MEGQSRTTSRKQKIHRLSTYLRRIVCPVAVLACAPCSTYPLETPPDAEELPPAINIVLHLEKVTAEAESNFAQQSSGVEEYAQKDEIKTRLEEQYSKQIGEIIYAEQESRTLYALIEIFMKHYMIGCCGQLGRMPK